MCVLIRDCVYQYVFVCFTGLKPDTSAYSSGVKPGDVVLMVGHCQIKVFIRVCVYMNTRLCVYMNTRLCVY